MSGSQHAPAPHTNAMLQQQVAALNEAVRAAQQHRSMLQALQSGVIPPSLNQGVAVAAEHWGDPNAILDSLLNDTVKTVKKLPKPQPRIRQASSTSKTHQAVSGQQQSVAKVRESSPSKRSDGSWELVEGADGKQGGTTQTVPGCASSGDASHEHHQQQEEHTDDDPDAYEYYVDDPGDDGQEYYDDAADAAEGQQEVFEEVLRLREQLNGLDGENAVLRKQLEQQKALMQQLQASLLMGMPSNKQQVQDKGSEGGAPGPGSTQQQQQSKPASPVKGSTGVAGAVDQGVTTRDASTTHVPVAGLSVQAIPPASAMNGFDALAATPKPVNPSVFTSPARAGVEQSACQLQNLSLSQTPHVAAGNTGGSTGTTTSTPVVASEYLAPNVDLLDGLGLFLKPAAQQAQHEAAHQVGPSQPGSATSSQLHSRQSAGAQEAVRAVEAYERASRGVMQAADAGGVSLGHERATPGRNAGTATPQESLATPTSAGQVHAPQAEPSPWAAAYPHTAYGHAPHSGYAAPYPYAAQSAGWDPNATHYPGYPQHQAYYGQQPTGWVAPHAQQQPYGYPPLHYNYSAPAQHVYPPPAAMPVQTPLPSSYPPPAYAGAYPYGAPYAQYGVTGAAPPPPDAASAAYAPQHTAPAQPYPGQVPPAATQAQGSVAWIVAEVGGPAAYSNATTEPSQASKQTDSDPQLQHPPITSTVNVVPGTGPGAPHAAGGSATSGSVVVGESTPTLSAKSSKADWSCSVCTYHHTGPEALYLRCAMCNALK